MSSLHALGDGAYAYFVSDGLAPAPGCRGAGCRQVPVSQSLIVVAADGRVVGRIDDVVDGLEGEAFHPWADGVWLVSPFDTTRTRRLTATITAGPDPVLAQAGEPAPPSGAWPQDLRRFNMIADPLRGLNVVAAGATVDLTAPGLAVLVQPEPGRRPDGLELYVVSRNDDGWRSEPVSMLRLPWSNLHAH